MRQNKLCPMLSAVFLPLTLCLALTGCRSTANYPEMAGSAALSREEVRKELMETPFVVGADDVLNLYVRHNPEVSGEFLVGPEGKIFMPLLGDVQAAGLTKEELEKSLSESLTKFIVNPEVSVGISQYRSKRVYVIGEVLRPGPVMMRGNILTVWDAIVEAGFPLRQTAALWRVHVITPDVENPIVKKVNLRSIMYGGKFAQNDFLRPGDIVVVPCTAATSLGNYLGQIVRPASQARELATIYEFFKNKSYFLDPLYGRYDRTAF